MLFHRQRQTCMFFGIKRETTLSWCRRLLWSQWSALEMLCQFENGITLDQWFTNHNVLNDCIWMWPLLTPMRQFHCQLLQEALHPNFLVESFPQCDTNLCENGSLCLVTLRLWHGCTWTWLGISDLVHSLEFEGPWGRSQGLDQGFNPRCNFFYILIL